MFTTAQSGVWVGLLVTSLREPGENTQETFDWASRAVKTFSGYLWFIFYQNWTRTLSERTVSSSVTIRNLATIWKAAKYIFFPFRSADRQSRSPRCIIIFRPGSRICRSIWVIKVQTMTEELAYSSERVIKMSMNTKSW